MTAPKCEDCRFLSLWCGAYVCRRFTTLPKPTHARGTLQECGPEGRLFQPKNPARPKALTVAAVRGSIIKPKEGKADE